MQKIVKADGLQKVEAGAMQKNLDGLLAKSFLTDAERQLADTLAKQLADGASEAAFEKALTGPRLNLHQV